MGAGIEMPEVAKVGTDNARARGDAVGSAASAAKRSDCSDCVRASARLDCSQWMGIAACGLPVIGEA